MVSKLKDVRVILSIVLVLSWIAVGVGGFVYHSSKTSQLGDKDSEISVLQESINQVGELVVGYTVAADTKMGKKLEDTDIVDIEVPISMATNLVKDKEELVGKNLKVNITKGTPISNDLLYTEEITDDLRLYDVVLDTIPIGIGVGSYVDVRISLPLGEDFIAMAHKKVHAINGGILKLAVSEQDIHSYSSMLVDSYLYPGTNMYAVEYLEGGAQTPANSYYPISLNVTSIAQRDPNLLEAIKSDILTRRNQLEQGLGDIGIDSKDVDATLELGKLHFKEAYIEAEVDLRLRLEKSSEGGGSVNAGQTVHNIGG